ncbi:MAG TPA: hypothetical protein PKV86_14685, partial [Syntrophobacteraceae bacterium]|nr:hypothetical protein [Syntrophobacteraceae bacterium]
GFYRIFRHRHLFTGYTYDGDDRIQRIVFQGRTIGTFNYDEERQDLTFSGGCFYERRDEVIPLPLPEGSYQPADGDIIYMEGSGRRFSICMLSTPGGGDWGYSYEVQDSALGSGGLQYAYIVPAFFFLAVSSFLYLKPYSIFQWMGF